MTTGRWPAASNYWARLWWPHCPRRGTIRRGARWWYYVDIRLKRTREINQHEQPQPAYRDEMTWPLERMLRTSEIRGMKRLYGLIKTGSLGALACRGSRRSKWYRRFWPWGGNLCIIAYSRHISGYFSTMRDRCKYALCLWRNQNWSFRSIQRSLISCMIVGNKSFSNNLPNVPKRLMGR
jgi:hypothetical protein